MNIIKVFLPSSSPSNSSEAATPMVSSQSVQVVQGPETVLVTQDGALLIKDSTGRSVAGWANGFWASFLSDEVQAQ